ncbi:MAG TPA: hypothetical protein ENN43_07100 [bacterium]|nr:hypothetical protein [bacterium]
MKKTKNIFDVPESQGLANLSGFIASLIMVPIGFAVIYGGLMEESVAMSIAVISCGVMLLVFAIAIHAPAEEE